MSKYLSLKQIMKAVKGEQTVRKSGEEQEEPVFEEKEIETKVEKSMPGETLKHIKYGLYKVSTTEDGEEKEFLVYSKFDPVLANKFQKGFRNSKDKFVKLDGSYNKTKHRWTFSMESKKDLLELLEDNAGVVGLEYKEAIKERKISPAISAQQRRELKQMEKMVEKEIKKSIKIERPVIEAIRNPLFGKTARRKLRKMKVFGRLLQKEEKGLSLESKKDVENKELMIFKNPVSSPEVFADERLDDYEETIVKPTLKAYMAVIMDLLQLKEPGLTFMIGDISAYINHYYNVLHHILENLTKGQIKIGLFVRIFIMPLIFLDINNPIGARTNLFRKRLLLGYYALSQVFTDFGPQEWFPELYTSFKIKELEELFEESPRETVLTYIAEYIEAEYLIIINRMYSMLYPSGKKYRESNIIRDYIPDPLEIIPIETSKLYGNYGFCTNDFSPATINKPEQIVDYWDVEENKNYCFDIKDVLQSGGINKYTGKKFTDEFYNSIRNTFELKEIETIEDREIDDEKMKEYKDRIAQRIIHENEYKDDLHKSSFEKCKACEKALEKKKNQEDDEEEKEDISMIKFPDIKMKIVKDKAQRKLIEKQLKDIWKEEQEEHPKEKSKECKVCHKIFTEGYTTTEFQEVKDNTGAITLHGEFLDTCSKKCFDKNKLKKKPIKKAESKEEKSGVECPELLKLAKKTLPEFIYKDLKNIKNKNKLCDLLDYFIAEFTSNVGTMPEIVNLIKKSKEEHIKLIYKILLDIVYEEYLNKNRDKFENRERLADEIADRLKAADVEEMVNGGVESKSKVSEDEEESSEFKETLYGSKYVGNKREIDRLKPSVDATYELKKNDELKEQLYDLYLRNGLRGTSDFELPHVSRKSRKHVRSDVKMGSVRIKKSEGGCKLNATKKQLDKFVEKLKNSGKISNKNYKRITKLDEEEMCEEISEMIDKDPMLIELLK